MIDVSPSHAPYATSPFGTIDGTGQYNPQLFAPQQFAPQQFAPQQFAPQQFAPQQYAPQGFFGDLMKHYGGAVGGTIGGLFGQPGIGQTVGNIAGQFGNFLPFQAQPQQFGPQQFAPQQFAPQQFAPQQFAPQQLEAQQFAPQLTLPQLPAGVGAILKQYGATIGSIIGMITGNRGLGQTIGSVLTTIGGLVPLQAQPQDFQAQQFAPQGFFGDLMKQYGGAAGGAIGGLFGQPGIGQTIGTVAGRFGGLLPFQASAQFQPPYPMPNLPIQYAPQPGIC